MDPRNRATSTQKNTLKIMAAVASVPLRAVPADAAVLFSGVAAARSRARITFQFAGRRPNPTRMSWRMAPPCREPFAACPVGPSFLMEGHEAPWEGGRDSVNRLSDGLMI